MECNYCNQEKGVLLRKDENGWDICEDCYEREVLFSCPYCQEKVEESDVDFSFFTRDDGLYQCVDKKDIWWGFGSVMNDLVLIKKADYDLQSCVNGICNHCANEMNQNSIDIMKG